MRSILLLIFSLFLGGCSLVPTPVPGDYHGPLARVSDTSVPISSARVQFFELAKVDGRTVRSSSASTAGKSYGQGFVIKQQLNSREVPATTCVLHLRGVTHVAADIMAFGGGLYSVDGDVTVKLAPAQTYFVRGSLSKSYSAVWLEDELGRIVSRKVEKGVGR